MKTVCICGVRAEVAESFAERTKGLIGRASLPQGTGLLIKKCNCIHTFFMRFAIDATFLDGDGRVVKTVRGIRPWRPWIWGGWRARQVLETASVHGVRSTGGPDVWSRTLAGKGYVTVDPRASGVNKLCQVRCRC